MVTKEQWDRIFLNVMPVVSTAIGTLSVGLATMALLRGSVSQRAYYLNGQYLVNVRYGQWQDILDFVQPDDPDVLSIYREIGPNSWELYDFVCRSINYRRDIGEVWQFPSEIIASGKGDCEDTSILLVSLLNNFTYSHVALGCYQGYGHAWCDLNGRILETTFTQARLVADPGNYQTFALFNEREVIELWPGALGEIFELERDELLKLNLITKAIV